jgi:Phage tail protein (Tail_P2_I)
MSGALPPAGSIADLRTYALGKLGDRLGLLDLTQLFVYVINNVTEDALPFLAWQFDVLEKFWQLEAPGATQRALIQQAIALHRSLGTPATLTTALGNLGFPNAKILEGQNSWGGNSWPVSQGWAVFRVILQPGNIPTPNQIQQIISAVNFFKPARCVLDAIHYHFATIVEPPITITETHKIQAGPVIIEGPITITETHVVPAWKLQDTFSKILTHNAVYYFAAGMQYNKVAPFIASGPIVINGVVVA